MRSFSEVSEGVEVSEVVEVSQLVVQVTSLQNDKSLRVIPERFFKHSIQFQQCLVRTDGWTDGRRDIVTY